jgi:large conductance mechanosensitive channel protein
MGGRTLDEESEKILEELRRIREAVEPKPAPPKPKGVWQEFVGFLEKHGVIGLALAVIVGGAASRLVSALVSDILMPLLTFFIREGGWREYIFTMGPVRIAIGHFVGAVLDFLIISLLVFVIIKQLEKAKTKLP